MAREDDINLRVDRKQKEYFNHSLAFISRHARSLMRVIFAIPAPFILITTFLSLYLFQDLFFSSMDLESMMENSSFFNVDFFGGMLATLVVSYIPIYLLIIVVFEYLYIYENDRPNTVTTAMVVARLKKDAGVLVGSFIVQTLLIAGSGCIAIFGFSLILTGYDDALGILLILIGLIPLAYLLSVMAFLPLVRIQEGLNNRDGMRRCLDLHQYFVQRSTTLFCTSIFMSLILGVAFQLPLLFFSILGKTTGLKVELGVAYSWIFLVLVGLAIASQVVLMVIPGITTGFRYYGLVEKKESYGLRQRIKLIGEPIPDSGEFEETY